jgi:hypothetical protein
MEMELEQCGWLKRLEIITIILMTLEVGMYENLVSVRTTFTCFYLTLGIIVA